MEGEVIPGPPDPEPPSVHLSFIEATSKRCPCGTGPRQSLFHSHGCHAMKDNRGCNEELCVVCLKRQSDNERLRPGGSWTRCRCGHTGMHSFCSPLNSADESGTTLRYVQTTPYPHDTRCGCPICPDCRPGASCIYCSGCCVCLGIVRPGPTELGAHRLEPDARNRSFRSSPRALRRRGPTSTCLHP